MSWPGSRFKMTWRKLFLIVLVLSLSITFTKSQTNESILFFIDISQSPAPQNGFDSSPVEISQLVTTSFNRQHLPTSRPFSNLVVQSSNNPIRSLSSLAHSASSILPSRSNSLMRPLFSTSMSIEGKPTIVGFERITVSSTLLPSLVPSPIPSPIGVTMTPDPAIMTTSSPKFNLTPSSVLTFSPVDTSTSKTFNFEETMTVDGTSLDGMPTPNSGINSILSIAMTGRPVFNSTAVRTTLRTLMESSSNVIEFTTRVSMVSSISLSPTIKITTSAPVSMETMIMFSQTTTEDVINESTKEQEESITRSTSTTAAHGITTPAVIGMVVAACLVMIATTLLILVLCYCFCRSRKYEYRTGNEYRVTVQKWNTHYAHYTANQCESVSSSRGSSVMSSFGFRSSNGKMKPRYGGVSSSADHVHTAATAEMYSTPL